MSWEVGQPASFDVQDAAPSAGEYVLGALGACLAMGFQIHAWRRFLDIEPAGHSGFRAMSRTLYVQAAADAELLQEMRHAPVHQQRKSHHA
jgi:hypothetical protein